jgi:gamma-glutamylputrescine oxidase
MSGVIMHAASRTDYYAATCPPLNLPVQQGVQEVDVCVVGGGFAGLNTALGLADRGVKDVLLLEAQTPAFGASGRNGGFVFAGYSRSPEFLLSRLGPERARDLYDGTRSAIETIRTRIQQHGIVCDDVQKGVLLANWFKDPKALRAHQLTMHRYFHHHLEWVEQVKMRALVHTTRYHDALFEPEGFHFHPLKYAQGLVRVAQGKGVKIYAHSPATSLVRTGATWRVTTPQGQVHAKTVVLACGGYLAGLRDRVDASVLPIATYVVSTQPLGDRLDDVLRTRAAIYDTRFAFDYYRPLPDTRILWGGRISIADRSPDQVRRLLAQDMVRVFPQLAGVEIEHAWSGLMSYARHQMPTIGEVEPGLWVAQAFGGHGVGPTTHAGELVAAGIAHNDTRWQAFSQFGLDSAFKPMGFLAAQLSYWWASAQDAWKVWREGA